MKAAKEVFTRSKLLLFQLRHVCNPLYDKSTVQALCDDGTRPLTLLGEVVSGSMMGPMNPRVKHGLPMCS